MRRFCELDAPSRRLLEQAMSRLALSARAYDRVLKVARTIADLAGDERVTAAHLAEAISYRPRLSAEEANRLDSRTLSPKRPASGAI